MKPTIRFSNFSGWRFYFVIFLILSVVTVLIIRLIDLTILKQYFLRNQSNARILRTVDSPAFRGMITDRNGNPLAVSTTIYSVWVDPVGFIYSPQSFNLLSEILDFKADTLQKLIQINEEKGREFLYLKRGISPELAKQIKKLNIPGIHLQESFKRYYPEGEVAAHIIGFTNIDDQGEEGLELAYNQWLSGTIGKKKIIRDRLGREIAEMNVLQEQKPGNDLILSIDRRIQYLAYRELMAGVEKNMADSGTVIVLDVKTGEVLAMTNFPSFNPNNRQDKEKELFRNRAVTDIFEPGSTMKTFTIALALGSGKYTPDTLIDTSPGWMRVGKNIVRDEHNNGPMTLTRILQKSSNVGASKIILTLPQNSLWNILHSMGFGETTGIGFPGERQGKLTQRKTWKPFALATLSFGYGISVTPLQLAHAYAIIANDGIKIPLSLLKLDKQPAGIRVMDQTLANQMLIVLKSVVSKGGTAGTISIPGYQLAGKTGTALMVGPSGYQKRHYHASFVGVAPASQPRIVIAVVLHNPKNKMDYLNEGGFVSAPIFEKIMEGTLRILDIPPDDLSSLDSKKVI